MALPEDDSERLKRLTATTEATREALSVGAQQLQHSLDFSARVKRSMSENSLVWIGAALAGGLVVTRLLAGSRKVVVTQKGVQETAKKSLWVAAAGLAFQLARPTLQKFLTEQLGTWLEQYQEAPPPPPRKR